MKVSEGQVDKTWLFDRKFSLPPSSFSRRIHLISFFFHACRTKRKRWKCGIDPFAASSSIHLKTSSNLNWKTSERIRNLLNNYHLLLFFFFYFEWNLQFFPVSDGEDDRMRSLISVFLPEKKKHINFARFKAFSLSQNIVGAQENSREPEKRREKNIFMIHLVSQRFHL